MSPLEYGEVETDQGSTPPRDRRLTRERILQHVQPAAQAVPADGVPGAGEADARRAPCPRVHLLGAVRRHAVLPARPRPLAAGDLRRAAQQRGQAQAPRASRRRAARRWPMPTSIGRGSSTGRCSRRCWLRCQPLAQGRRKFRFKNKLVSLDSTVIDLCATLFDWAKFRRTKGAVKLHCLLDHDGYLPSVVVITEGKRHDVRVARTLRFDPGTIVVMDRGYTDYAWFGAADGPGGVVRHPPEGRRGVRRWSRTAESRAQGQVERDQVIRLTGVGAADKCPHALRRIEVYDPEKDETLVFLTNHLDLRGHDDRRDLQGPLADRAVLQGAEAEPEDQDLRGDQRQRPEGPGLDGADRHAAPQVPPAAVPLRLVALEPGRPAADEPLHPSRSLGVARSAVRGPARPSS